ncbi:MAG: aminotransferase class I/II-fold pyridoxal phosphate-dependent enzyme [Actinomycetota bacterium]
MESHPIAKQIEDLFRVTLAPVSFFTGSSYSKRAGDPTISDYVAGNPHDMALPELAEAFRKWSVPQHKDWFAYTDNHPAARESVAKTLSAARGETYEPEDVFLVPGTFGALSVSLRVVVDRGDEVLYISPPWFFYEAMIMLAGASPTKIVTTPPDFDLDLDALAGAITTRTRAVIINTPNNPSGRILSPETLEGVGRVLREASQRHGRRIYLLSDESYRRILFDGNTFTSPADYYDDTFVLYTYGKTLLAPGQRIGYIALPPRMRDREVIRNAIFLSQVVGGWQFPNAVLQYALPDLEELSVDVPHLQERRDRVVTALREMGYEINSPESTFYLLVKSPIPDDWDYAEMLAEHDVFVLPGRVFELPGYFRLSITANDEMIERSFPGFEKALKQARG